MKTNEISSVIAERLPSGMYRYVAVTDQGEREVIRKKATKAYEKAFLYNRTVCTGPAPGSLASVFTFGKKPGAYYVNDVEREFVVQYSPEALNDEDLVKAVLDAAGVVSYYNAAEGDAYRQEAGARNIAKNKFYKLNSEVKKRGLTVDLSGFLVP